MPHEPLASSSSSSSENHDPNLPPASHKRKLKSLPTSSHPSPHGTCRPTHPHPRSASPSVQTPPLDCILTSPPRKQHIACNSATESPRRLSASKRHTLFAPEAKTCKCCLQEAKPEDSLLVHSVACSESRCWGGFLATGTGHLLDKDDRLEGNSPSSKTSTADNNNKGSDECSVGDRDTPPNDSVSPEKTGNWRLKAVLEEFGDLTPTREGRVKTLVRAFEKLMSSKNKDEEEQQPKPRGFPLQFTYLSSAAPTEPGVDSQATRFQGKEREEEFSNETKPWATGGTDADEEARFSVMASNSQSQSGGEYSSGAESVNRLPGAESRRDSITDSVEPHFSSSFAHGKKLVRHGSRRTQSLALSSRRPLQNQPENRVSQIKSRVSKPQPFKLLTEERGKAKKEEFIERLKQLVAEEERLRIPLAQGLPWTTDEPDVPPKPHVKDNTVPLDIHLNTDLRAMERADFDQYISEKLLYLEQRRLEEERLQKIAEELEIKKMRQQMVPKAQLMPYFDRPFLPRRSSKRPTIPKEPQFHLKNRELKRQPRH